MGDLRRAETSNAVAMELLAKHAVDALGQPISYEKALAELDDMDMLQFYETWAKFQQALLPNLSGRR